MSLDHVPGADVKPAFDQGVIDFPSSADFITILTSADGKVLTKRHTPAGMTDFDGGKWFTSREVPIGSLADLAAALECPSDACVILGRVKPGVDPSQRHRRLLHPAKDDGTPPSYDPAQHNYVLLDVDEKPPRDGKPDPEYALTPAAWVHDIPGTMRRVLRDWLPPELSGVAFKWRLTSSAGLKPGIHVRLAFMLDRAVSSHELDMWFADYPNVDQAAFRPVQPIYCAAPIFDGVADPVKQRSGGFRGEREHVAVPADLAARVKQRREREIETGWQQGSPIDLAEIEKMIEVIPPPEGYETIKRVAAALGDANVPDDPDLSERLELFTDWNSRGSVRDHDGEDRHFERLFRDMARPAPAGTEPTRVGTLIKIAQLNGYELPPPNPADGTADTFDAYLPEPYILEFATTPEMEAQAVADRAAVDAGTLSLAELIAELNAPPATATSANALATALPDKGSVPGSEIDLQYFFASRHHRELRHVADWGWLRYDGKRWQRDKVYTAWSRAREIANGYANVMPTDGARKKLASRGTVSAVVDLARSDPRIAATTEQWDTAQNLLNTQSGIVDLETGEQRDHAPDEMLTKITSTGLDRGGCPLWKAFLAKVTNGDRELQAYLQRVAGYCLTGSIKEHAMFFLYGTGANGKGVFLNTLTAIFGDYAKVAPVDMFTVAQGERHSTDMAMLRGARLVTAQETEEGQAWAEAKIKSLTGGDPVTARFMRQDFFTYEPQFKLVIAGNHKPGLSNVDEAIRRRMHLIPFTITIPEPERDKDLADKLHAEHGAILAWAVEGCREWQRVGLMPPPAVRNATETYFAAQDPLADWIDDRLERDPRAWLSSADLYGDYRYFAERSGERPMTRRKFSDALGRSGFVAAPSEDKAKVRGYFGGRMRQG